VRRFRAEGILDKRRGRIRVLEKAKLEPLVRDRYMGLLDGGPSRAAGWASP